MAKAKTFTLKIEFSRIDCLVWFLHESAKSFSLTIQTLESARRGPELAMAWVGVDVHSWHKNISYQVAVYALLKATIEVELFLSHKRHTNASVSEILYPTTSSLRKRIEDQLILRNPKLVNWFKMVELPRIAGIFIPLFKKWSMDYAGSGVAGIILAISCCIAVRNLGSGRLSCPSLSVSIEKILVQLMNSSYTLVSVNKLHHLAREAGFEEQFLLHFGKRILPSEDIEDIEFWIGLVQTKLSVAFHRESVILGKQEFCNKDQENHLVILGLFAFLGKETRLFLSRMKIKDLDEQVVDFLSYLECGILFIYPRFSSLPEYQLFMEVVTDEIGWLDLYAEYYCMFHQERSKKRTIQAKKEIILNTVFTVCYDVFVGFAHYIRSTQQPLDSNLHAFLQRSQSLLSICMEDYWAAYDRSGELVKKTEGADNKFTTSCMAVSKSGPCYTSSKSKSIYESLPCKFTSKLISYMWMGTQLLWFDVLVSINHTIKQLRGEKVTKRERKKMARTLADIAKLIPLTTLMLINISASKFVSAAAHAAILFVIKRWMPYLIPFPHLPERLDMVKRLHRTREREIQEQSTEENEEDENSGTEKH